MIEGEEKLPMSIMERITDAPCEPHAYLDYAIADINGRLDYWKSKAPDGRWWDPATNKTIACVVANLDIARHLLEETKDKFTRWPERLALQRSAQPQSNDAVGQPTSNPT